MDEPPHSHHLGQPPYTLGPLTGQVPGEVIYPNGSQPEHSHPQQPPNTFHSEDQHPQQPPSTDDVAPAPVQQPKNSSRFVPHANCHFVPRHHHTQNTGDSNQTYNGSHVRKKRKIDRSQSSNAVVNIYYDTRGPSTLTSLEPPSQSSRSASSSSSQDSIATPRSLPTSVSSPELTVANGKGKMKVQTPSQRYVSLLSECGLGYPVWRPSPRRTEAGEEHVINIGDVGIVRDGLPFHTLFNITQSKDSLANRDGIPKGVDPPCVIHARCITVDDKFDEKGRSHIRPQGSIVSGDVKEGLDGSRVFNFTLTNIHGALLLLPQGSVLKNLEPRSEFISRIQRYRREWYDWAEQQGDLGDQQALYVVTGVEKCSTWAIAAWDSAVGPENLRPLSLELTVDGSDGRCSWAYTARCETQSLAKPAPVTDDILNQTVFIRGFWINRYGGTIGGSSPLPAPVEFEGDSGDDDEAPGGGGQDHAHFGGNGSQQNLSASSSNSLSHPTSQGSDSSFGPGYSAGQSRYNLSPEFPQNEIRIANLRGSGLNLATHPCQVINNLAFELISNIDPTLLDVGCVAFSHDDDWISIIQESDEELPSEAEIIRRISAELKYVVQGETIYTSRMSNTDKEIIQQSLVSGQNTTTLIPLLIEFRETEFEPEGAIQTATNASNSTCPSLANPGKGKRAASASDENTQSSGSERQDRARRAPLKRVRSPSEENHPPSVDVASDHPLQPRAQTLRPWQARATSTSSSMKVDEDKEDNGDKDDEEARLESHIQEDNQSDHIDEYDEQSDEDHGDVRLLPFAPSRTLSHLHNLAGLSIHGNTDALNESGLVDDIVAARNNIAPSPREPSGGTLGYSSGELDPEDPEADNSPKFIGRRATTNDISSGFPSAYLPAYASRTRSKSTKSGSGKGKARQVESDEFTVALQSDGTEIDAATRIGTPEDALTVSYDKNLVHPEELLQIKRPLEAERLDQPIANDAKESDESEDTIRKAAPHSSLYDDSMKAVTGAPEPLISSSTGTPPSATTNAKEESREYNFFSEPPRGWKKRRLQGACDTCSTSVRSSEREQALMGRKHLYLLSSVPRKKRGPKSPYVENLEKKVRSLEDIIRKAATHVNLDDLKEKEVTGAPSPHNMSNSTDHSSTLVDPSDEESEDDFAHIGLSKQFRKMTFKEDTIAQSFFGPSSGFMLLKRAHASKTEYTGHESIHNKELKREDYWRIHPWETEFRSRASEHYTFPEHDLLWHLIDLYFEKINVFFPILHGPTFRKAMMQGQHLVDPHFGGMVLMVCALGAKYSDDPRVFYVPGKELSAGWGWFRQVRMTRGSLFAEPSIYELQLYCMTVMFIIGTSSPQVSYMLIGIGIRYAIELGIHRRKPEGTRHTAQHEQERRVFWVLLSLDRCVCNFTGRPSALRDEDFDQELPADCDDEYWEHPDPELAFKQPPGKPSSISCFILYLKLCEILAFALRTLYSIKKSKMMLGLVGNQWEQRIISELDSSLDNWINSIPEHLRWDPGRENMVFFNQSAFLQVNYYNVQIQTHRPFIMKPSPLMFLSLAICTNAARSCINVLHRHSQRAQLAIPHTFYACFAAGMVLLTHIWNSKSAGLKIDVPREMSDVHKLMQVLSDHDKRWTSPGRFLDIFCELARGLHETKEEAEPAPLQSETQSPERFSSPPVHQEYHVWQDVASMEEEQLPPLPFNSAELGRERFGYQYSMPQQMEQQQPPQPQQQHQQHYGSATAPNGWDDPGWIPNVANIPSGYSLYDWGQYLDNKAGTSSNVNAGRAG